MYIISKPIYKNDEVVSIEWNEVHQIPFNFKSIDGHSDFINEWHDEGMGSNLTIVEVDTIEEYKDFIETHVTSKIKRNKKLEA